MHPTHYNAQKTFFQNAIAPLIFFVVLSIYIFLLIDILNKSDLEKFLYVTIVVVCSGLILLFGYLRANKTLDQKVDSLVYKKNNPFYIVLGYTITFWIILGILFFLTPEIDVSPEEVYSSWDVRGSIGVLLNLTFPLFIIGLCNKYKSRLQNYHVALLIFYGILIAVLGQLSISIYYQGWDTIIHPSPTTQMALGWAIIVLVGFFLIILIGKHYDKKMKEIEDSRRELDEKRKRVV